MRKCVTAIVVAIALILGVPGVTSAHVLKVDGTIGAVLHINPDDDPTAGGPTDYTLSFDDDTGKFSLAQCKCTVAIIEQGTTIATQPLAVANNNVSEDHYTFAEPDVYDLRVTGIPMTPGTFQPFTLDYAVRVAGGQAAPQPMPVLLWVGMGMSIGLILLAAFWMDYAARTVNREDKS